MQTEPTAPTLLGSGGELTVRPLRTSVELRAGVDLYRRVFALGADDPAVTPRLLVAIRDNGGIVLGAFDADEVVGFVYGFTGRDPRTREVYHYSQLAVVAPDWQGRSVGRRLKLAQRDIALEQGLTRMRWTFDPLRGPTGYFNLDVLGAAGRWFSFDLYGDEGHGRDHGRPSHRLIAEWDLEASRRGEVPRDWPSPPAGLPVGQTVPGDGDVLLTVPPPDQLPTGPASGRTAPVATIVEALADLTGKGFAAVSCRRAPDGTFAYRFRRHR